MVPAIMIICGLGIAGIWSRDILIGIKAGRIEGLFKTRDHESGSLMWPHWIAEFATSLLLILGAITLIFRKPGAVNISLLALGALVYTALNSLSWALAKKERYPYAIPMIISLIFGMTAIGILI